MSFLTAQKRPQRIYLSFVSIFVFIATAPLFGENSKKVILMSFDGGMNELLHDYLDSFPKNKGFSRIQREGVIASQGMTVSLPSLTATSHISIVTGVEPGQHGIVSNNFHIVTDPMDKATNGFSAKIDPKIKTLWELAREEGKKVGVISYPALDNTDSRRSADWSVNFSKTSSSPASIQTFGRSDFNPIVGPLPEDLKTYSPAQVAKVTLSEGDQQSIPLHLVAIDSTPDDHENYDILVFDLDSDLLNGYLGTITPQGWLALRFVSTASPLDKGLRGSWAKLLVLSPSLSSVKIYLSSIQRTEAFPKSFQKLIDERLGFWPGPPDRNFLGKGLTEEDLFVQAVRFSEYLKDLTLLGAQTQGWDLILTYQPILDELEHQFLLKDPRQKDYSVQKSQQYMDIIRRGYLQANKVVDEWITQFPKSNLLIVSDHGMAPLRYVYYPNRVLAVRGYTDENELDTLSPPKLRFKSASKQKKYLVRAFSSGGFSHVYVNLQGRGPDGIIPSDKYDQICEELVSIFKDEEAIEKVYLRKDISRIGLDHENSGDVILVAKPGYHLNDSISSGDFLEPATFYGQHGHDPALSSMKAIHAAWGPDIKQKKLTDISYKDILPLTLKLLKNGL